MSNSAPGQFWIRLKYTGGGAPPSRDYVGETLLLESCWINASDIYSFIALPNKKDYEICFYREAPLRRFLEIQASKCGDQKWRDWTLESSIQIDTTNIVVKFWTGRIADQDIELYLRRYCTIIQKTKPVDKFGIWYGIRKYKVKLLKGPNGQYMNIPNSISLGPYNGRIIYPGQTAACFICQSLEHQVRQCPLVKCWKCGDYGHKAKDCESEALCSLCGEQGHTYFTCPSSYYNKSKTQPTSAQTNSNTNTETSYAQAVRGQSMAQSNNQSAPKPCPGNQPGPEPGPTSAQAPVCPLTTNGSNAPSEKPQPSHPQEAPSERSARSEQPPPVISTAEAPPERSARSEQSLPATSAQPGNIELPSESCLRHISTKPPPGANVIMASKPTSESCTQLPDQVILSKVTKQDQLIKVPCVVEEFSSTALWPALPSSDDSHKTGESSLGPSESENDQHYGSTSETTSSESSSASSEIQVSSLLPPELQSESSNTSEGNSSFTDSNFINGKGKRKKKRNKNVNNKKLDNKDSPDFKIQ